MTKTHSEKRDQRSKACRLCDEPVSIWVSDGSGFCPKCRRDINPGSLSRLSWTGWLVTALTIAILIFLAFNLGTLLDKLIPPPLPWIAVAAPIILISLAFFGGSTWVLGKLGLPLWKPMPLFHVELIEMEDGSDVEMGRLVRDILGNDHQATYHLRDRLPMQHCAGVEWQLAEQTKNQVAALGGRLRITKRIPGRTM